MGSSNRGQLRPHFTGRSPPFLVAALCVGLAIMGISYYTLSSQYTEQQHDFAKLLEKNQLLEKEVDVTKQQLHLKEDEFVKSKTELESVNQELTSSKKSIEEKIKENSILQSKVKDLQSDLDSAREDVTSIRSVKESLEKEKSSLREDNSRLLSEKESLLRENNRLQQDLQKALSRGKGDVVVSGKTEKAFEKSVKKKDGKESLVIVRDDLGVLPSDKKDGNDYEGASIKGKSEEKVVGDEVSGKIGNQSGPEDKLNIVDSKDAAEEAKRRDPSA